MAMTIKSNPATDAAGHNDMIYVIDSTNKAQSNYQYILTIRIGGVVIATLKNRPNPAFSNYGVFNISSVIQNYLNSDYFKPSATQEDVAPKVMYQVRLSESYGSTTNTDVVTDAYRYAWNAALPYLDSVQVTNYATFVQKFITERPNEFIEVDTNEDHYVCAFGAGYEAVHVKYYANKNASGLPSSTAYYNVTASTNVSAFVQFSGNTIINVGTKRFNPGSNQSYTVSLASGFNGLASSITSIGNPLRFNVTACHPYEPVVLHFMNRLGGYETMHFRLKSRKRLNTERKKTGRLGYQVTSAGGIGYKDSRNVIYDTERVYAATYRYQLALNSAALTDAQFEWLEDLITSPVVYVEQYVQSGTLYVPVQLTTDEYEFRKRINDKVSIMSINIQFSEPNASQLR
jgi:hypothetical protein